MFLFWFIYVLYLASCEFSHLLKATICFFCTATCNFCYLLRACESFNGHLQPLLQKQTSTTLSPVEH